MLELSFVVIRPDPAPAMTWAERISGAIQEPVSARLQAHLVEIEHAIQAEIAMRGGGSPTNDECIALLTVRNYLGQCDAILPPPPEPYVAPLPEPKRPRKPPMEPIPWEETMDADEVAFCMASIKDMIERIGADFADNFRAARMWKSSQRRRFAKQRAAGCCGSHDFVAKRWSWSKMRYDRYLLGFNYGH
jgi:hypothetical protein